MKSNSSRIWSTYFLILCISTLVYIEPIMDLNKNSSLSKINLPPEEEIDYVDFDDYDNSNPIKKIYIPGNFKTKAFISYDQLTSSALDSDGVGLEWVEFDENDQDGSQVISTRFSVGDHPSIAYSYPLANDTYILMKDSMDQVAARKSIMYTPEMANDTTISGKLHYLINIHRHSTSSLTDFGYMDITLKVTLLHFFNGNSSTKEIDSIEHLLDTVAPNTQYIRDVTLDSTISEYTIPAGDRLKVRYEIKYSNIAAQNGHVTLQSLSDEAWPGMYPGNQVNWVINDGIYSNSYQMSDVDALFGLQLYMREEIYPEVNIYNVVEDSVYQTAELIYIDVTDGTISYYRWDAASWILFENDTSTTIPTIHGWHTLEVSASETIYNNTVVKNRTVGYDASYDNLQLHNAVSGEKLSGGFVLNFTAYNITSVSYAWDGDPTPIVLSSPYDITTVQYNGLHNLTVNTTDFYKTRSFNYQFYFDSDSPIISLNNVVNDTFLLEGKTIKVQINDYSDFKFLNYSWDGGSIQNWLYDASDIYSTEMPIGDGYHWLMVFAEDEFGHSITTNYRFETSSTVFSIDLKYWDNESYHYGGEDVELIIQQSNTTLYFSWNGGVETNVTVSSSLVLNGADVLPSIEGMQNLTIRTFNQTFHEHVFLFRFIVDRTAPDFNTNYLAYNNTRFLATSEFSFYVTDNYISNNSLIVQYSIDGKIYKSFDVRFLFPLFSYTDGLHSLEIYAKDKAGNTASFTIYFTIDTTDPEIISVTIPDLVDDSAHGSLYVPENALVVVIATDADPGLRTFYKWDDGPKIEFSGSFILTSIVDKQAKLTIYANDTLGKETKYDLILRYDSTPPIVTLQIPFVLSKINDRTWLEFNVQDITQHSILSVEFEWEDWGLDNAIPDEIGDFKFQMNWLTMLGYDSIYQTNGYAFANLTITAEDLLGHIDNFYFMFEIDQYPPELGLYYFDGLFNITMEDDGYYELPGGTDIWYNSSANDDLSSFQYIFDDEGEYKFLFDPWNITIPTEDGNHTLQVILADTAGEGLSINTIVANFTIGIDDIKLDILDPIGLQSDDHIELIYNETFSYTVNVTDAVDNEPIDGLQYILYYDAVLALNVTVSQIDNSTFEISIHATNVTKGAPTNVDIRFYNKNPNGGQPVRLSFTIYKKEVDLTILNKSDTSVVFGENFQIYVTLQNEWLEFQTINKIIVDSTLEITDYYFNITTMECVFNYSSTLLAEKGNYSIYIKVESLYYYGNTSSEFLYDLEVKPLSVILDVWVLNSTILEGTPVTIYANLTLADGTPIAGAEIYFTIYIYLKDDAGLPPEAIRMSFTDFNGTDPLEVKITDSNGLLSFPYTLNSSISSIEIEAEYLGDGTKDESQFRFDTIVVTFPPPEAEELPIWLLGLIIGGSILIAGIISFIIYKATRPKPFEELMKKITDEEIALNYSILSPGIMLSIFDQRKGPIPLVTDHSLSIGRYLGRMQIGIGNFLLKIADQAYSSLGFEEHTDERRVGSIVLPSEKMIGFLQGIQLKNPKARGGFENLSLIVLADREYGNLLLNYQEYLYPKIDELDVALKGKDSLKEVEELMKEIRKVSVIIILAAQKAEKAQENGNNS